MDAALLDTEYPTHNRDPLQGPPCHRCPAHCPCIFEIQHGQFSVSEFTYFEVIRGLRLKRATSKIRAFDGLSRGLIRYAVNAEILDRAADLWVSGRTGGHPHSDGDLIIAATALVNGLQLVTGNTSHYAWMTGLQLANWTTN